MWDVIRSIVAEATGLTEDALVSEMVARGADDWPPKVVAAGSVQGVGSERWCRGYVAGAIREGYLDKD